MKFTHLAAAAYVFGLGIVPANSFAEETITLTVATGHAPVVAWVKLLDEFYIPEVDRRLAETGNYKIEWTKGYSSTIAKIGGEIDAVEQGVADLAIVGATFNPDRLPLQTVSYYTPFVSNDLGTVVSVIDELNRSNPAMIDLWKANNLKYLSGIGVDNFEIFSTHEVKSYKDFIGDKIGGIGPNLSWLLDGMTGVALLPNSAYTDLQTGVYEAALVPTTLGLTLRVSEATDYLVKVNFGAQCWGAVAMNAEVFDGLPDEVQKVFEAVGIEYTAKLIEVMNQAVVTNTKTMVDGGLKIIELPAGETEEWAVSMKNTAKTWSDTMEAKGLPGKEIVRAYLDGARARGGKPVRDWDADL